MPTPKRYQRLTPSLIADIQADLARRLSHSLIAERRGVCKTSVHRVKNMKRPAIVADFVFDDLELPTRKPRKPRQTQKGIPTTIQLDPVVLRDFAPRALPITNTSGRSYSLAGTRKVG